MAVEEKATVVSGIDDDDLDEEPGEEIESAPPLKVGEEREFATYGLKKKLLKSGTGWESPEVGDEATGESLSRNCKAQFHFYYLSKLIVEILNYSALCWIFDGWNEVGVY